MKNVDVDIYISQVIKFFESNPDELKKLIGDLSKDDFFVRVREISLSNHQKGDDAQLTRKQILDLIVQMNNEYVSKVTDENIFLFTIYGLICLN